MGRLPAVLVAIALVSGLATGCSSGGDPAIGGRIAVVAGENFWGDIAAQIGGSQVAVTSIITDPNTDPHVYQTDPRAAAEISTASFVIENGLGYDDFMDKILATGGQPGRRVLTIAKVLRVTGENPNPHLWYWTARLPAVASAIAGELSAIRPARAAYFRANARRFDASLAPLLATIAAIRKKYAGTRIAYTERVPGYLVQAAGLVLGTPASFSQAIEDGNDPSPQDTAAFDAALTHHTVKVLLYNSQVVDMQTTQIKDLASSAHVPIVGVSETMPPGETFQSWQLEQDRELLAALGG